MRGIAVLVLVFGCSDDAPDGLDPPACTADSIFRYVHDLGGTLVTGEFGDTGYAFGNAQTTVPGTFDLSDQTNRMDRLHVEFTKPLLRPGKVPIQGFLQIDGLDAGNCETEFTGTLTALPDDGWTFELVDLREGPTYCDGASIGGSFAACIIPEVR